MLQEEKKDASKIKAKLDEVNKKIQDMSIEMYQKVAEEQQKNQGQHGAAPDTEETSGPEDKSDDNVVDAEFTEQKDGDKPKKKGKK